MDCVLPTFNLLAQQLELIHSMSATIATLGRCTARESGRVALQAYCDKGRETRATSGLNLKRPIVSAAISTQIAVAQIEENLS
jgi:hypothetical protein